MAVEAKSFPVDLLLGGETFTIGQKPARLISLSPDLTEALGDIGAAGLLAGVSDYCAAATGITAGKPCGTALALKMDVVEELEPDVILTSSPMPTSQQEELDRLGISVLQFSHPVSVDDILARYRNLFLLCFGSTSGEDQAKSFNATYQGKLDKILLPAAKYSQITQQKSAIMLAILPRTVATGDTFEHELMEKMGIDNLGADGTQWVLPGEDWETPSPDFIFYDSSLNPDEIVSDKLYKQSPAVVKGQLVPLNFSAISRQNLGMIAELSKMAVACYPDAFSGSFHSAT